MREVQGKQVELRNLIEHVSIVKRDLQKVNEDIEIALSTRNLLQNDVADLEKDKIEKSDELSNLVGRIAFFNKALQSQIQNLEDLDKEIKDSEDHLTQLRHRIDKLTSQLGNKEVESSEKIQRTLEEIDKHTKLLDRIKSDSQEIEDELSRLESEVSDKQSEIRYKENQIASINSELEEAYRNMVLEKLSIESSIEDDKEKISAPLKSVIQREKELARREKRFDIMFSRFKRVFEKQYPGITFTI